MNSLNTPTKEAGLRFIEEAQQQLKETVAEPSGEGSYFFNVRVYYKSHKIDVEFRHSRCKVHGIQVFGKTERSVTYSSLSYNYPIERLKVLFDRIDEYLSWKEEHDRKIEITSELSLSKIKGFISDFPEESKQKFYKNDSGIYWILVEYRGIEFEVDDSGYSAILFKKSSKDFNKIHYKSMIKFIDEFGDLIK